MSMWLAGLVVLGTSAAVMVLEILAGRLLAPYLGVTLETWTGIIGTILAGIALGTWLGGRLADRVDPRRTLGPLLVVGGALTLAVVPLVGIAGGLRLRSDPVGIVTFALLCCLLPAAVLSAVNPTVVKIQLRDLARTGSVVGRLSAIGTTGAIAGTFLTGFVLVAAVPSRPIVIALGATLIVAGVLLGAVLARATRVPLALLGATALVLGTGWTVATAQPCERESAYFCIRVDDDATQASTVRTLRLDTLRHATVDLADPTWLGFAYTRAFGDVIDAMAPAGEAIDALHIGGGGFTMPRYIAATRPGSTSLVLELDPQVLATARDELGLVTGDDLVVRTGDARTAIADAPSDAFDLVVGDAFGGLAVPWHLTTRELVAEVARTLRPGGLYILNVIDYPPLAFARAELATLADVFQHVAVLGPPTLATGRSGGNVILLASDQPLPVGAVLAADDTRGGTNVLVSDADEVAEWVGDAEVLTDDFAPVDQLLGHR
ncbi:MAG: fused MFS/spermidine synthase [Chloroflexota bacterium]